MCGAHVQVLSGAEVSIKIAMIRLTAARLAGQQTRYHDIRHAAA
jgi:uncharacterized small protein (DUF1192 family)